VLTLVVNISDRIKDVQRGKKYSRAKKEFLVDKVFVLFEFNLSQKILIVRVLN